MQLKHLALVAAFVAGAAGVAQATFECERVWSGPSADNSITDCVADPNHLVSLVQDPTRLQYGGGIVIAIMGLVWWMIVCPCVTICRYCCRCFGSYRRRPGAFFGGAEWDETPEFVKQDAYDPNCVRIVFWLPFALAICCAAPMGLLIGGGEQVQVAYDGIFADVGGLATWLDGKSGGIQTAMTRSDGTLIPPLTIDYFVTINASVADLRSSLATTKSNYQYIVTMARDVGVAVGCVPLFFFILNAVFAIFSCRTCLPLINSFFFFVLIIIFGVVAIIALPISLILRDACGEVNAYRDGRKPGIVAWYVVPTCKRTLPFDSFKNTIDRAERENSVKACTELMKICKSDSIVWNPADPKRVFFCDGLTNATRQCTAFANVSNYINTTKICTPIVGGYGCTEGASSECTFRKCASGCNPQDLQDAARTAIDAMDMAAAALRAFNEFVRPVLDCEAILDVAIGAFASCDKVQLSLWYLGTGALLFQILSGGGLVSIWVGQKRWFSESAGEESRKQYGAPSREARLAQMEAEGEKAQPSNVPFSHTISGGAATKKKKPSRK